jgi:hypothetical protein
MKHLSFTRPIISFSFLDGLFYAIELSDLETSNNSKGVDGANDLLTLLLD